MGKVRNFYERIKVALRTLRGEQAGIFCYGSAGSGMTIANHFPKMTIEDPNPEFVGMHGPSDVIFNPADQRSAFWTPLSEV
jgi:hypothetical protein